VVIAAFALQPLLRGVIDLPFAARVAIAVALLAPVGLLTGMAMPVGVKRLAGLYPDGFTVATLVAAACYAVAAGHAQLGRWP
jgi:hypothetical protein